MRSQRSRPWIQYDWCPYERCRYRYAPKKQLPNEGDRGWSDGSYKWRNAKDCLKPLKAYRGKKGCSLIRFRGILTLLTPWIQTSILQGCEIMHSCGFKPPGLWYFITAVPGNSFRASQDSCMREKQMTCISSFNMGTSGTHRQTESLPISGETETSMWGCLRKKMTHKQ